MIAAAASRPRRDRRPVRLFKPLVLVLLAATLAGVAALAFRSEHHDAGGFQVAFASLGMAFGWSGVIANERRPDNPIGALLVAVGFGFAIGNLELSSLPLTYSVGLALDTAWVGLLVHALAIYPTGRFDGWLSKAFAVAGWTSTLVLQIAATLVAQPNPAACPACPENLLAQWPNPEAARAITALQGPVLGTATVVLGGATLARRWRDASPVARRAILPTMVAGLVAVTLIVLAVLVEDAGETISLAVDLQAGLAILAIPGALLVGVLRIGLTPSRMGDLARRLNTAVTHDDLRAVLAWALDDPDLTVHYWSGDGYVDADGQPVDPMVGPHRSSTVIEHEGRPVALLDYDDALDEAPQLVEAVAATAGLALENERLRTELRARLVALSDSRARIVAAEEAERRRLERNLHDGAQQRLLGLGLSLQLARSSLDGLDPARTDPGLDALADTLTEAERELRAAIEELRDLANGLHPAILTESGLGAAIGTLADRAPFPVSVEGTGGEDPPSPTAAVAYYVVAEALANATKHAGAERARIEVDHRGDHLRVVVVDDGVGGAEPDGSGLTGLADRVGAVGGTLTVHSPPGAGTRIEAVLPCG